MTYTNAQVALQAAMADIVSKRSLEEVSTRGYYASFSGSKFAPPSKAAVTYNVQSHADAYLKWLDDQDGKSRTFESLEERVSRLEGER